MFTSSEIIIGYNPFFFLSQPSKGKKPISLSGKIRHIGVQSILTITDYMYIENVHFSKLKSNSEGEQNIQLKKKHKPDLTIITLNVRKAFFFFLNIYTKYTLLHYGSLEIIMEARCEFFQLHIIIFTYQVVNLIHCNFDLIS